MAIKCYVSNQDDKPNGGCSRRSKEVPHQKNIMITILVISVMNKNGAQEEKFTTEKLVSKEDIDQAVTQATVLRRSQNSIRNN